jgi:hypothetical protein
MMAYRTMTARTTKYLADAGRRVFSNRLRIMIRTIPANKMNMINFARGDNFKSEVLYPPVPTSFHCRHTSTCTGTMTCSNNR